MGGPGRLGMGGCLKGNCRGGRGMGKHKREGHADTGETRAFLEKEPDG